MRALLALFICVLTLSAVPAAGQQVPASSYGEAVFLVSGRGWGRGVGMSQYGAYGQAQAGRTSAEILGHSSSGSGTEESWGCPMGWVAERRILAVR